MGQYAGNPAAWIENIYQFELTDVVEGGPDGIDNEPLKNLADRTAWLKENMGGIGAFSDVAVVDNNAALTMEDHFGKLIAVNAAGKTITITLNSAATYKKGTLFAIMAFNVNTSQVTVQTSSGQILIDDSAVRTKMYLGDGDKLWVVAGESSFYIADKKGNFETVGEPFYSHTNKPNSYRLLGQTFTSISDPRLAEYAESLGSNLLADNTRLYVNLLGQMPYQAAFSKIDATTYRLPDLRGVAIRGLDLGSGRDISRLWEQPGGYEHDALKRHNHFSIVEEWLETGSFPVQVGRDVTPTKAPIKAYSKTSGGGRESATLAGQSGTFPSQQPTVGPNQRSWNRIGNDYEKHWFNPLNQTLMGKVIIETGALANGLYFVEKTGAKQFSLVADDSKEQLTLTGNYAYILPDGKMLDSIVVKPTANTILRIGTTTLGGDIMPDILIPANKAEPIILGLYADGSMTLYFSGIVSNTIVKIFKR